jgi:hypothetical protein
VMLDLGRAILRKLKNPVGVLFFKNENAAFFSREHASNTR